MYDPVINKCSELFDVHRRDILSVYRYGFLMPARFALCKALHLCGLGYRHIGRIVNKDHSTVKSAVHRANYMMECDPAYATKVDQLAHIARALTAVKDSAI